MCTLKGAIARAGGVPKAALICGVSVRAVYKWIAADVLPRTEYTGETSYLMLLSAAAAIRGAPFDATALKQELLPTKSAA